MVNGQNVYQDKQPENAVAYWLDDASPGLDAHQLGLRYTNDNSKAAVRGKELTPNYDYVI